MLGIKIEKTAQRLFVFIGKIKISFKIKQKKDIKPWENISNNRNYVKQYLQNNKNKNLIFVIGDSHSEVFHKNNYKDKKLILGDHTHESQLWFNHSEEFCTYHFDAITAYNSNNPNATISSYKKIRFLLEKGYLPKGSTIIVSMGEIDCRVHIQKQSEKQQRSIDEIIDDVLKNYEQFLLLLKNRGYKVIVYGPIPTQSDTAPFDENFPRYGTEIERNKITQIFNKKLEKMCEKDGIEFKTLFNKLINDDMTTKSEFLSVLDNVHLGSQAYYLLKELFIKQDNQKIAKQYIPFAKIDSNKTDIYVLTYNSGEVFVYLQLLKLSKEYADKSKQGIIIATKKYHIDLIEMICPEFDYIYHPEGSNLINCDEKDFVCSDKNIHVVFPKYLADSVYPLWTNKDLEVHYFDTIKDYAGINPDFSQNFELTFEEQTRKNLAEKIKKNNLCDKFIFIAPEAMTTEALPFEFWNTLCENLNQKGYDVYLNLTKDKDRYEYGKKFDLSIKEANLLASWSSGIISVRSGFSEQLAMVHNVPNIIIYTDKRELQDCPKISSDRLIDVLSLKRYPNISDNIYEYTVNIGSENVSKRIEALFE